MRERLTAITVGFALAFGLGSFNSQGQALEDCSQEALQDALDQAGGLVIVDDCSISVTASNGLIIATQVSLVGSGTNSVIEAEGGRIFEVQPGARLEVSDMTFTGGSNRVGGAVFVHQDAEAVFSNCVFSANSAIGPSGRAGFDGPDYDGIGGDGQAGGDGDPGFGGAVYNLGNVTFLACRFIRNTAVGGDGGEGGAGGEGRYAGGPGGRGGNGGAARGGAIFNLGTMLLSDTLLQANTVTGGDGGAGGVGGEGPSVGITGSGGSAGGVAGAGIYNEGILDIVNSTVWTNRAIAGNSANDGSINGGNLGGDAYGGGWAFGAGLCNAGESWVTNSTFVQNRAIGGNGGNGGEGRYTGGNGGDGGSAYGGGIYNAGLQWLMNCTLAQNGVARGTNGLGGPGPTPGKNGKPGVAVAANVFGTRSGEFFYKNSIFGYPVGSTNGAGGLIGVGNNLSSDGSMPLGPNSFRATNPLLFELSNYGGPTPTMLPQPTSKAVNGGDFEGAPEFDQRGVLREDEFPDIGAVELSGPAIIEGPESVEAVAGSTVTFTVEAIGDPPLGYVWRKDGTNITGARSASYTIQNVAKVHEGAYSVVVTNAGGSVESEPAILTVVPGFAPVITLQPQSRAVLPGANVTFSLSATGSPPIFVQWRSNNVAILRATNFSFTLTNVQSSYAAGYSAQVSNTVGTVVSDTALLTVGAGAPVITNQPQGQTVAPGANVTFTVGVTGAPPLFVQWRSNNVVIPGATNFSFQLLNVQTNYAADYTARITNSIGPVVSDIARLRVQTPPPVMGAPLNGTNFNLSFPTVVGLTYVTEFNTNLSASGWIPLTTNMGTGGAITNVDGMTNLPMRFYRIRAQ